MSTNRNEVLWKFLRQLSSVNDQIGYFILNLVKQNKGLYSSDADQQERYAENWARQLVETCPEDPFVTKALQEYSDSIAELAGIRRYADRELRNEAQPGKEIYDRLMSQPESQNLGFEESVSEMARKLNIEMTEAADLKAYLVFEHEKSAKSN